MYSMRAANTNTMQAMSQPSIAVSPSACKYVYEMTLLANVSLFLLANLRGVSLYCVENVDQNQKDGDEEGHSSRYNLLDLIFILYCCEKNDQKLWRSGNYITELFSNMGQLCFYSNSEKPASLILRTVSLLLVFRIKKIKYS